MTPLLMWFFLHREGKPIDGETLYKIYWSARSLAKKEGHPIDWSRTHGVA